MSAPSILLMKRLEGLSEGREGSSQSTQQQGDHEEQGLEEGRLGRGWGRGSGEGLGHGVPVAEVPVTAGALQVDVCPGAGGALDDAGGPVAGSDIHRD